MKLQTLALGLVLAAAGSAFAGQTKDTTVTHVTPSGTVTKHVVRTSERHVVRHHPRHMKKVVVVKHPNHRYEKKVVVLHPSSHGSNVVNRTVVVHHNS